MYLNKKKESLFYYVVDNVKMMKEIGVKCQ